MDNLEGIILTPLKIIPSPKGNIMHALKAQDKAFNGFGEAYFSAITKGEIKGWKKHFEMTLNLIVPVGEIKFVVFDDRPGSSTYGKFFERIIGDSQYERLTVPPLVWMAFQGMSAGLNLLLNIASIEHNPDEAENRNLAEINFNWNEKSISYGR